MDTLRELQEYELNPAFAFAFSYSFSNRIALGIRFDRTDAQTSSFYDKGRITSYSVIAAYRPIITDDSYLEARAGFGTGVTAFRQSGRSFYSRGSGGLLRAGVSWVQFLTKGVGVKLDVSAFAHSSREIKTPDGEQEWYRGPEAWALTSKVRMATVGLLVRY